MEQWILKRISSRRSEGDPVLKWFKKKTELTKIPDREIANVIAYCNVTRVADKPYFTINGTVWSFKGSKLVCVHNGVMADI